MKEYIDIFDGKDKNLQDVIDDGFKSKALRENSIFSQAVKEVYWKLTLAEDKILADMSIDGRKAAEESKRCAKMRALLVDVVLTLDGNILEGENAAFELENNNNG